MTQDKENLGKPKEQYRYEFQIIQIMIDNYGISLEEFTKLAHEKFEGIPYHDITSTHERMSAEKIYCVVETDNYGGDYPDEKFLTKTDEKGVTRNIIFDRKEDAERIATAFNSLTPDTYSRWFKIAEKNYKLSGAFEP